LGVEVGGDGELGPGVETVPSEPKEDSSEDDEGGGVTGHIHWLATAVEAAEAWANEEASHETGQTTNHVHNTGTGVINHARLEEVTTTVVEPATVMGSDIAAIVSDGTGPHPMDDNRVDKGRDEERVTNISVEIETLSNSTSRDGSGSGGEGPLEEPELPHRSATIVNHEIVGGEHSITNETITVVTVAESESISSNVPTNGRSGSVQNSLKKNVHGVLGTNSTSAKHGETSVHNKNKGTGAQKERSVDTVGDVAKGASEGVKVSIDSILPGAVYAGNGINVIG